jgi:hypothetical protein
MTADWSLPSDHVFVMKFAARSRGRDVARSGRIEHLRSGEAACFDAPDQVLAFTRRVLNRLSATRRKTHRCLDERPTGGSGEPTSTNRRRR